MNDNLITYAELARRLNKSKPYISKIKYRLVDCLVEVKIKNKTKTLIDYEKAKQVLTKDSKDKNVRQTLNKQAKQEEIKEEHTTKQQQQMLLIALIVVLLLNNTEFVENVGFIEVKKLFLRK